MELLNQLMPNIVEGLVIVLGFIFTRLGLVAKDWFDDQTKRALAEQTVQFVRQVGKSLGTDEKFELAKETLIEELNDKKIKFTKLELQVLIESAYSGFKSAWDAEDYEKEIYKELDGEGIDPIEDEEDSFVSPEITI